MNQAHMIADLLMALVFAVVFGMAYAFAVYKINQADDARGRRRIQRRADYIGIEVSEWLREPERRSEDFSEQERRTRG